MYPARSLPNAVAYDDPSVQPLDVMDERLVVVPIIATRTSPLAMLAGGVMLKFPSEAPAVAVPVVSERIEIAIRISRWR